MNIVAEVGRMVADAETRYTQSEKPVCIASFRIAVNRDYKDKDGNIPADFFDCKAFRNTGEFIAKYFHKGDPIALSGRLEQEQWEKDGKKYSRTIIVAEKAHFTGSKGGTDQKEPKKEEPKPGEFMDAASLEGLPF